MSLRGVFRPRGAARRVELGIPSSTYRAVFQPMAADVRKRRGNVSSIRRAHPRASLSSVAIRVGPCKDRARAGYSTSARDCARVRGCDRIDQFPTTPPRRKRPGWFRVSDTDAFRPAGASTANERSGMRRSRSIRWTRNDAGLGVVNSQTGEVEGIRDGRISFRLEDRRSLDMNAGEPPLRYIDRAWASTVHAFQDRTVDNVIAAIEANHPNLTKRKMLYVEISRARDRAEFVTDDKAGLKEQFEGLTGERIAALEVLGEEKGKAKEEIIWPGERRVQGSEELFGAGEGNGCCYDRSRKVGGEGPGFVRCRAGATWNRQTGWAAKEHQTPTSGCGTGRRGSREALCGRANGGGERRRPLMIAAPLGAERQAMQGTAKGDAPVD